MRDNDPFDHDPPHEDGLLALASQLVDGAGRGRPRALARLSGGKNNQVYRIDTDAGGPLLLKRYFRDPRDPGSGLAPNGASLSMPGGAVFIIFPNRSRATLEPASASTVLYLAGSLPPSYWPLRMSTPRSNSWWR